MSWTPRSPCLPCFHTSSSRRPTHPTRFLHLPCHLVTMSPPHPHTTTFSFFILTLCPSFLWLLGSVLRNHFCGFTLNSKGLSLLLSIKVNAVMDKCLTSKCYKSQTSRNHNKKQESIVKASLADTRQVTLTSETTT